ncbi:mandelate racemase/muconate lactonizing enzyme family protein [Pseudomonas typographi]|uniref:Mandelate racemase/muconate lactonizing enzyme family protein n=1 Tax=Pseudomonas typographi TaxID=2715964 RepID=A0ABR7Z3G4_9PSED|nr:mandelate racemase/muconate lactonizing enzyme family protein [Pseudomonas typographi]MBD1550209.1 mandelate racemase/muconate lactonizing enzyme family protein [Pseudomonas typographi]MBD1586031.1 mandelate racemase/muconate lactonizing enzyme family protein [Pseudomonas typographi]MBD1599889.1 mandelate racemase/muconate lactonizing enzyme family protein [Pseudomonas typographi]
MKIIAVELLRLSVPFTAGARRHVGAVQDDDAFNAASPRHSRMESLIVKVHTDTGHVGWGEAFGHGSNPVTFEALKTLVSPQFIGVHITERARAMEAARKALHGFGSSGPVAYALAGMDIALWDLAAQQAGQPLWQYLGGQPRELELYASLVSYGNDPQTVALHVSRAREAGFTKVKLHETEYPAIAAARQALPAEAGQLMVDVNCPWSVEQAAATARQLRELGLTWLEEPVWPPDDAHGLAQVRREGVPLAAGENAAGVNGIRALLDQRAVDIIQPSVAKVGGITAMLEVFALAQGYGVQVVPHCFYFGPGLLAVAHLCTLLPAQVAVEVPFIEFEALLYPQLAFTPRLSLPERPGLGFAPDADVMARYCIAHARVA